MTTTSGTLAANAVRVTAAGRAWSTDLRLGGALLTIAGVTILMGIITAEALYPNTFTTGGNEISDLGTPPPPHLPAVGDDLRPVHGGDRILVIAGSWFIHRIFGRRSVTIPMAALGVGALVPGNTGAPHAIFAMVTFVAGGVAAVSAARSRRRPSD